MKRVTLMKGDPGGAARMYRGTFPLFLTFKYVIDTKLNGVCKKILTLTSNNMKMSFLRKQESMRLDGITEWIPIYVGITVMAVFQIRHTKLHPKKLNFNGVKGTA